jgi:hypothetical protein
VGGGNSSTVKYIKVTGIATFARDNPALRRDLRPAKMRDYDLSYLEPAYRSIGAGRLSKLTGNAAFEAFKLPLT